MAKRILVTGGAGFLGSHLVDRLLADGHRVMCVDDLSTGARENLVGAGLHPRFTWVHRDVRDPRLAVSLPRCDFDEIYNLACPASPIHYQRDPIKTLTTNVVGTFNVLELAQKYGARVLQASTSEVYGDPLEHPQPESYLGNVNPIGPRACYDEGKRAAETLCADFERRHGVQSVIVRIFNTYGPRMARDDGRVVSSFIAAALEKRELQIAGDGSQTRSFCYVDDTVDGLVRAMNERVFPSLGPINIGNPTETSLLELADMVVALVPIGRPHLRRYVPGAVDDPRRRCPDIAAARRLLGFEPRVLLWEGLRRTIEWMIHDLSRRSTVAVPA